MPPDILASPCWQRALTFAERLESLSTDDGSAPPSRTVDAHAARVVDRWTGQFPFLQEHIIESISAACPGSPEAIVRLIGEPLEELTARNVGLPAWVVALNGAFAREPATNAAIRPVNERVDVSGVLNLVAPLIRSAREHVEAGVRSLCARFRDAPFDDRVVALMDSALPELLVPVLSRSLALEVNARRIDGTLEGSTPQARFRTFCARLLDPEISSSILNEYPVLARHVVDRLTGWVEFYLELLEHLCDDWSQLRAAFSPDVDPGRLTNIVWHKGDSHRGGRHVVILEFGSVLRLVYKPKALAVDVHFQALLTWLNARIAIPALPTLQVLDRGKYGWVEFVVQQPCGSTGEVARFYQRQGAYLALLHVLAATDVHLQNLIASGENPVIVDLETLFHPRVDPDYTTKDPASAFLRSSVLRVGMLPHRSFSHGQEVGVDMSSLGGAGGQELPFQLPVWEGVGTDEIRVRDDRRETVASDNRPTLNGVEVDARDHADALVDGFAAMYRGLVGHRHDLLAADGPLLRFVDDEVRVVLRPTVSYALLRQASYHPDVLRDALDRDVLLGWLALGAEHDPRLGRVIGAELHDVRRGDIPMFVSRPASSDLWTSSGQHLPGFSAEPAMTQVRETLKALSEDDLDRQLWLLRASLVASTPTVTQPQQAIAPRTLQSAQLDCDRLVAAACEIGRRVVARALRDDTGAASWIVAGPTSSQRWLLRPAGVDLYDGLPGIALVLAHLAPLCAEPEFDALARGAVATTRRLVDSKASRAVSIGGFDGMGGVLYSFTHLACLWKDEALLAEAGDLVVQIGARVSSDRALDVIGGAAGALLAVLGFHRIAPSDGVLAVAHRLGRHLVEQARVMAAGCAWETYIPADAPLTGFGHGASGIGLALFELFQATGTGEFRDVALKAFAYERSCFLPAEQNWRDFRNHGEADTGQPRRSRLGGMGWCHGAPGIALARLRALRYGEILDVQDDARMGVATTQREGLSWGHCLCHGALGNLEVLLQATDGPGDEVASEERDRTAMGLLSSGIERGWSVEQPAELESPGLMTGLAGVAYGLIRVAHPHRVPAVLVMEPPKPEIRVG